MNGERQEFLGGDIIFSQGKDISESEDNAAHMQLSSLYPTHMDPLSLG